jgi:hypothetical protein
MLTDAHDYTDRSALPVVFFVEEHISNLRVSTLKDCHEKVSRSNRYVKDKYNNEHYPLPFQGHDGTEKHDQRELKE